MKYEYVRKQISDFIAEQLGKKKGVIGLSGGIDSSIVAYIAVDAVGKNNIIGVMMPYGNQDISLATSVANNLEIPYLSFDIRPGVDFKLKNYKGLFEDRIRKGNLMARERMEILYDVAYSNKGIVVGTTNKSELMTGYFTKHGDGAVDIEPIAGLYKTEIYELARYLEHKVGFPKQIIDVTPTAGLWEGQTDEAELGLSYHMLDEILKGNRNFPKKYFARVDDLVEKTAHKRRMPLSIEVKK